MLAVVEHQEPGAARERSGNAVGSAHPRLLGDAQDGGHRFGDGGGIGDRGELDDPHAVGEFGAHPVGHLEGQPRLTHAAHPGQRDQAVRTERLGDVGDVLFATDDASWRRAEIPECGIGGLSGGNSSRRPSART